MATCIALTLRGAGGPAHRAIALIMSLRMQNSSGGPTVSATIRPPHSACFSLYGLIANKELNWLFACRRRGASYLVVGSVQFSADARGTSKYSNAHSRM